MRQRSVAGAEFVVVVVVGANRSVRAQRPLAERADGSARRVRKVARRARDATPRRVPDVNDNAATVYEPPETERRRGGAARWLGEKVLGAAAFKAKRRRRRRRPLWPRAGADRSIGFASGAAVRAAAYRPAARGARARKGEPYLWARARARLALPAATAKRISVRKRASERANALKSHSGAVSSARVRPLHRATRRPSGGAGSCAGNFNFKFPTTATRVSARARPELWGRLFCAPRAAAQPSECTASPEVDRAAHAVIGRARARSARKVDGRVLVLRRPFHYLRRGRRRAQVGPADRHTKGRRRCDRRRRRRRSRACDDARLRNFRPSFGRRLGST